MRVLFRAVIFLLIVALTPLLAQEEGGMPTVPPPPLDDPWFKWMVGEWKGSTTSAMGKTTDHMISKMDFDGQFMISTYQSTGEDGSTMDGMSMMTITPDGKLSAYWIDSWRSMSQGSGSQSGNTARTEWTTPMGIYVRTTEKVDENTMKITGVMPMGEGNEMRSETVLKRVTN